MTPSWLPGAFAAIALLTSPDLASAEASQVLTIRDANSSSSGLGSWASIDCSEKHVHDIALYPPSDSWAAVQADEAWQDVIRIWRDVDKPNGLSFTASIAKTLRIPLDPGCADLAKPNNCQPFVGCTSDLPGPAASFLWNSLVRINGMHSRFFESLHNSFYLADYNLESYGPVPPRDAFIPLTYQLITVGTALTTGPYTTKFLESLAYFRRNATVTNYNQNQTTLALMGQKPTLAKDFVLDAEKFDWTPAKGVGFYDYVKAQARGALGNTTAIALRDILSGDDASIERLWDVIADGQMLDGKGDTPFPGQADTIQDVQSTFGKAYYSLVIPSVWRSSGVYAFVMDSGVSCDEANAKATLGKYLSADTMNATGTCFEGKQYFLVNVKGSKGKFSTPKGLETLDGKHVYDVQYEQLIAGSLRTYAANSNKNGGSIDLTKNDTLIGLANTDLTTPGLVTLPVCTAEQALQGSRGSKPGSNPSFPCPTSADKKR